MLVTPLYQGNKDGILPKMWQIHLIWVPNLKNVTNSESVQSTASHRHNIDFHCTSLIETLYRENDSFRNRDLIRVTQCRIASKFSDAELLHNIIGLPKYRHYDIAYCYIIVPNKSHTSCCRCKEASFFQAF